MPIPAEAVLTAEDRTAAVILLAAVILQAAAEEVPAVRDVHLQRRFREPRGFCITKTGLRISYMPITISVREMFSP